MKRQGVYLCAISNIFTERNFTYSYIFAQFAYYCVDFSDRVFIEMGY